MRPVLPASLREAFYVCSHCKQGPTATGISPAARQFRRYASSEAPGFLERTRRKLWKDGIAPGGKDPYTGESQLTHSSAEDEEFELAPGSNDASQDLAPGDNYEQASTWEDLETIGYSPENEPWSETGTPTKQDSYKRYGYSVAALPHEPAAHRTSVELCLMHMLGKPLTSITDVSYHSKVVNQMLKTCTFEGQNWETSLRFPDQKTMETLVFVFNQIGPKSIKTVELSESWIAQKDGKEGHQGLPVTDSTVKFAFAKRYAQRMGRMIPGGVISSSNTVGDFVSGLSKEIKDKPVNVAKVLSQGALPSNIKFTGKRETRADRDEELGRKKAITAELYQRGLILPKTKKFSSFKSQPLVSEKMSKSVEA